MFIRKAKRSTAGRTYVNYLLVESVRTPKGPRQKVVCSLGDLSPRPREEWIALARKVEAALTGQKDLVDRADAEVDRVVARARAEQRSRAAERAASADTGSAGDLVAVRTDQVSTELHREAGPVHVGYHFWKRLGLDLILEGVGFSDRARLLTCAMTLNRLVHPSSEHAMPDWIRSTALGDALGVDFEELADDALYRNLDRIHAKRVEIETALVERERSLFNLDQTVFLYDLTSTYFEGRAEANPKAKLGYSRDHRPDCKQVVVGLVINREGFPLAHEVFDGHTQDRKSLGAMLDALGKRVTMKPGQTVVVDRGMAYADNLDTLRARGLHYVIAARVPERNQWLADFEDSEGFVDVVRKPSPRNEFQTKSGLKVKSMASGNELHVLCHSDQRVEKDRAIREKQETRFKADLERLKLRIVGGKLVDPVTIGQAIGRLKARYTRVARYYQLDYDPHQKTLTTATLEDRRAHAVALDGCYLLRTDRTELPPDEAWRIYNLLTRAEAAFRAMKSPLAERPIFHQVDRRVDTHIFLCVLAYHLLVSIEKTLLDQGAHTSWASVRDTLRTHQVCTVVLPTHDGDVLRIRKDSTPEPQHTELYDLLDVPHRVMTPRRTWHAPLNPQPV